MLARIRIAKVYDEARLNEVIRDTVHNYNGAPDFDCLQWVVNVVMNLIRDKNGGAAVRAQHPNPAVARMFTVCWIKVEAQATKYIEGKIAEGRYNKIGPFVGTTPIPTYCCLEMREIHVVPWCGGLGW